MSALQNDDAKNPDAEFYATIGECCGIKQDICRPAATVYELGIDSLGLVCLISYCETNLSMTFDDATIFKIMSAQTVGQIVEVLKSHRRENEQLHR